MEEELIKLETAKLAKEKGFDLYCTNAFINREYLCEYHVADNYYKYSCKEDFPLVQNCSLFLCKRAEPWYKAPSQTVLAKWLREIHDIDVWVEKYPDHPLYFPQCPKLNLSNGIGLFQKYEVAMEAILLLALKLIKIDN